jgi:hypothetical protein
VFLLRRVRVNNDENARSCSDVSRIKAELQTRVEFLKKECEIHISKLLFAQD